jgi:hypothetical protein
LSYATPSISYCYRLAGQRGKTSHMILSGKLQAGLEGNRLSKKASTIVLGNRKALEQHQGIPQEAAVPTIPYAKPSWTGQLINRPGTSTDQQASTPNTPQHSDTRCMYRAVASP